MDEPERRTKRRGSKKAVPTGKGCQGDRYSFFGIYGAGSVEKRESIQKLAAGRQLPSATSVSI